ncbi:MAG: sugar ABC transporter permease [Thermomicrobiales bacterium]
MSTTARKTAGLRFRTTTGARTAPQIRRGFWERLAPYLLIAPFVFSFLILFVIPALYSLVLSLYRYRGYGKATYIGTANYDRMLNYHQFWSSWTNTIVYWLGSAALTIVLSFLLAVLVYSSSIFGKRFYKPAIFIPNVMAAVAAALIFQIIFSPESGVLNAVLGTHIAWDQNVWWGRLAVILLRSWHSIGWFFVIFLAGLTTINPELYDAAKVDGANAWQTMGSITIPLMRRTFLFALVIISINSMRLFAEPNLLFSNNLAPPQFQPIMNQLYQNLRGADFGAAAAVAWLIFIPIVVVSLVQFRLLREREGDL